MSQAGFLSRMVLLGLPLVAAAQAPVPGVQANGNDVTITAGGIIGLSTATASCDSGSLCGLVDVVPSDLVARLSRLESIASAANSRAQDLEDETSRLRDSLNDRALVADTATAEDLVSLEDSLSRSVIALGPLVKTLTVATGQPSANMKLGIMAVEDILSIDVSITECRGQARGGGTITLLERKSSSGITTFGAEAMFLDYAAVARNVSGARLTDRLILYTRFTRSDDTLAEVYAVLARDSICSDEVSARFSIRSALGNFDGSNSGDSDSFSPNQYHQVATRAVDRLAAYALDRVEAAGACAARGLIYRPATGTCDSPQSIQIGDVVEIIKSVDALDNSEDDNTTVLLSLPGSLSYPGIIGAVEYFCESGAAGIPPDTTQTTTGQASFSGSSAAGSTPSLSIHSLSGDDHIESKLRWLSNTPVPKLLFAAQHGMECIVTVHCWNATRSAESGQFLPVRNPSFELPQLNYGWTTTPRAGWRPGSGTQTQPGSGVGFWHPPASANHQDPFNGRQVLYINNAGCVEQETTHQILANRLYTLGFWTYRRQDHPHNGWSAKLCAGPCDQGGLAIATGASDQFNPTGPHENAMFVTIDGASAQGGGLLSIEICGTGHTMPQRLGQSNYDQVTLSVRPNN